MVEAHLSILNPIADHAGLTVVIYRRLTQWQILLRALGYGHVLLHAPVVSFLRLEPGFTGCQ